MADETLDYEGRFQRGNIDDVFKRRVRVAIARQIMLVVAEPNEALNHEVAAKLAGLIASPMRQDGAANPAYDMAVERFSQMLSYTVDLFVSIQVVDGVPTVVPLNLDLSQDSDLQTAVGMYWPLAAKAAGFEPTPIPGA